MKCGVEHGHLWNARQELQAGTNAVEIGWVVEWRELAHLLDFLDDVVGDERRQDELLAPVDDPMPNRDDLVDPLHDAPLRVGEQREHAAHRLVVTVHLGVERDLPIALRLLDDPALSLGDTDALGNPLRDDLLSLCVDELVLERRATAV